MKRWRLWLILGLLTLNCFSTKPYSLLLCSIIFYIANELKCHLKEVVLVTNMLCRTDTEALQLILPLHFLIPPSSVLQSPVMINSKCACNKILILFSIKSVTENKQFHSMANVVRDLWKSSSPMFLFK